MKIMTTLTIKYKVFVKSQKDIVIPFSPTRVKMRQLFLLQKHNLSSFLETDSSTKMFA